MASRGIGLLSIGAAFALAAGCGSGGHGRPDSGDIRTDPTPDGPCTSPLTSCAGTCTDTSSDPQNCGSCGLVCPATAPICSGGRCTSSCASTGQPCSLGPCCPGLSCIGSTCQSCSPLGGGCSTTADCCSGSCVGRTCTTCATYETSCSDGVDNDCNGYTDCSDPYCATNPLCSGGACPGPFTGSSTAGGGLAGNCNSASTTTAGVTCFGNYTFNAIAGNTYTISTCSAGGSCVGDTCMVVSGACTCNNDDSCGLCSGCTCTATSSGPVSICASTFSTTPRDATWTYAITGTCGP